MTSPTRKSTQTAELFAHSLKLELDREADGLDMATQSHLNQRRHQVLSACPKRPYGWRRWSSGLVVAGIASLVLSHYVPLYSPPLTPLNVVMNANPLMPPLDLAAIELMLTYEEELEIVEELDLYAWLVAEYG